MQLFGFILVTAVVLGLFTLTSGRCKFPKPWKGRWYQSGLGEIIISSSMIRQKGVCVEHSRDLYVIENVEDSCYRCLLLMKHHRNIIQYKETFCLAADSLKNICSQIRVEAPLYTLVREPAHAIQCPFEEAYKFSYSDGFSPACSEPASSLKPCVGGTRVEAQFRHCSQYAQFSNQDLQLQCLGTWKEGSDFYLYGRFTNADNMLDTYRCFKYEHFGPDLFISMSADGSCRGLRSAKSGPLVVTGSKDPYGWLQASCAFPSWLDSESNWRSLPHDEVYELDEGSKSLLVHDRSRHGRLTPRSQLRCVHVDVTRETAVRLVSFSTHDCSSSYQCVTLSKLHDNAIYIHLGDTHDVNDGDVCGDDIDSVISTGITENRGKVLIPTDASPAACPLSGTYTRSQHGHRSCDYSLAVGCGRPSLLHLNASCSNHSLGVTVQCLASWRTDQTTHLILQNGPHILCMSAKTRQNSPHNLELSSCDSSSPQSGLVPGLEGTFHRTGACIPGADIPDPITYPTTTSSIAGEITFFPGEIIPERPVMPIPDNEPTDPNNNDNNNNNNDENNNNNVDNNDQSDHTVSVENSDESSSSEGKEQQYKHVDKTEKEDKQKHTGQHGSQNPKDPAVPKADSAANCLVPSSITRGANVLIVTLVTVLLTRR